MVLVLILFTNLFLALANLIIVLFFAHPKEKLTGGLNSHTFALLVGRFFAGEPGFKTLLGYHIIVVEAKEDIGQHFCKKKGKPVSISNQNLIT